MNIEFECPYCQATLKARHYFGMQSMCPKCGNEITIPVPQEQPAALEPAPQWESQPYALAG